MKEVNIKRLRLLIEFLKNLDPVRFNFSEVVETTDDKGCGTICCAVGWLPVIFPELVGWDRYAVHLKADKLIEDYNAVAERVFNLSYTTAEDLFTPCYQSAIHESLPLCDEDASPLAVADMLEKFIELVETGEIQGHKI